MGCLEYFGSEWENPLFLVGVLWRLAKGSEEMLMLTRMEW
jgi:hypothetical protein